MEDIKRIERVEGFVGQLGKGRYSFHVSETRLRLPHTSPATLFISKDDKPPKVVALEEVLPYMQHKKHCELDQTDSCTCKMFEVLQRINERSK